MSYKVFFSVIVPYFNNPEGIERLLSSIPSNCDVEVIIVNDHSPCIKDILSKFDSFQIKYTFQDKGKRWAGAARNKGLKLAEGKYILFADSDDYFLSSLSKVLEKYKEQNYDLIYLPPTSIKEYGGKSKRHLLYKQLIDDYLLGRKNGLKYRFHVPWSKIFLKKYLDINDIAFDEVIASNDVNFSLKASYFAKNIVVDLQEIYCVVESENSLTKNVSEEVVDSRFYAACRYNDFLIEHGDNNLAAMSGHLKGSFKFGFYKFLSRFFHCKYKKYKIFYDLRHAVRTLRYLKRN